MKVKLPIIGQVQTGKDVQTPKKEKTLADLGAGFIDLSNKGLNSDKSVSDALIKSFNGWVYANVSVLAEEISKMEFELYQAGMSGGEMTLKPIDSHPLLDILDRFNAFTTTSEAMYMIASHLELAGDTFLYLEGAPYNIKNIYILSPEKVTIEFVGTEVSAYVFKDTVDGKKVEISYKPEEIIQIKNPNPANEFRGKSTVEAAAIEIDTDNLATVFLKNFFQNGAVPNITFSTDKRLSTDDIERLTKDIKKNYAGARNAFKALFLGSGLTPVTVQQSGKEMQLIEIQAAMRDKIMAIFKNTKASLGIVEDVNRANAEATLLGWKQSVIKPKMARIVDTLNEFLVPLYGDNLVLSFCDPVPDDDAAEVEKAVRLKQGGIINRNEARELVDYEPVEGGDNFNDPIPFDPNATPDNTPKSIRSIHNVAYRKHLRRLGMYNKLEKYKTLYPIAKEIAEVQIKGKKVEKILEERESRYFTNDQVWEYYAKQMHIVDAHEKKFANAVEQFLAQLEEKAIKNLHQASPKSFTKQTRKKAFDLFDVDTEIAAGIDFFTPLMDEIAKLSALEAYNLLNLRTGYIPSQNLHKQVLRAVKRFTKSFIATDQAKLADILETGIKEGQSMAQISNAIQEQFGQFRKTQADRIASTETIRISNAGAVDAYKASGVVYGKQWLTAEDDRVCPYCEPMNGTIIALEDSYFDKGSEFLGTADTPLKLDYASVDEPPLHVTCRCTTIPVLANELSLQLAQEKKYTAELEKKLGINNE